MISDEDKKRLTMLLQDELNVDDLEWLDNRLMDSDFKDYYQSQLDKKYDKNVSKLFVDYLPMIVFVVLVVLGLWLLIRDK